LTPGGPRLTTFFSQFVVDDLWTTDHEAPQEDDGHHNVNNILMPAQIKKTTVSMPNTSSNGPAAAGGAGAAMLSGVTPQSTTAGLAGSVPKEGENDAGAATISSVTPQSTTAGLAGSVPKEVEKDVEQDGDKPVATVPDELERSTSPPGAFPETPANENQEFGVEPIPASEGIGNPVSVPAGEKVPDPSAINSNTVDSTATTSKEGYEKDASAAFPAAAAAAGVGIASAAGAGAYAHEKKPEADAFSVNPIPASSGIGNPISVPAGEKLPEQSSFNPNTVQSSATTSKEAYEKDASASLLAPAAIAGAIGAGAAADSAFSVPEKSKNMIPESSLPMGGEAKDTTDTGPFISSAAPQSSSSDMASTVPLEPKRQGMVIDEDEAPSATLSGPAPTVPEMVKESLSEAHQSPEAAGSAEVVGEKALMENKLLKKVKSTDAAGEPAPSAAAAGTSSAPVSSVASNVPAMVKESISESHQPAEAAGAQEVVNEKRDIESELLREVKSTDAIGEPAPSAAATGTSSVPVGSVASNVPATVKESIREAHQPAEAAGAQEVVNEKRDMENELLKKVKSTDAAGEPAPSAAAAGTSSAPVSSVASNVPATVKESIREAHQPAEAAGAQEVVNEKRDMESELLRTVKSTDAAGEPAPTAAAATSETAPTATGGAALGGATAGAATLVSPTAAPDAPTHAAPYEASTPGTETLHPAPDASHSKPENPATTEPPTTAEHRDLSPMSKDQNAPATPAKATTTGNTATKSTSGAAAAGTTTSATSSPASTATKEQKKKNRRSFFGKLKDKLKDL
jgi:hypothetical protein